MGKRLHFPLRPSGQISTPLHTVRMPAVHSSLDRAFESGDGPIGGGASTFAPPALRAIIVKRDRTAAEFIRHAITRSGAVAESDCHQTAASALQALRERPVYLGVFGVTLSDMDGLDLISIVITERLALRILAFSSRRDELVRAHLRPGRVDGFFNPELDDLAALPSVINRVAQGGMYFSPEVGPGCGNAAPARATLDQILSPHELRIFALLGDGCDDGCAAEKLGLSAHTVHGHRQRIMRKLDVQTRTDLMRVAIQRGVVRITPDRVLRPGFDFHFPARNSAPAAPPLVRPTPTRNS
jgi:DNA-binding NarL/FixJ family response regulator